MKMVSKFGKGLLRSVLMHSVENIEVEPACILYVTGHQSNIS